MRVAHVVSNRGPIGGAERVMLALLHEGTSRGWEQLVLNPFSEDTAGTPLHLAADPVSYRGIPCPKPWHLPAMRAQVALSLKGFDPDLVHVHLFHALVTVATVRRRQEARLLSHQHGRLLLSRGRRAEALVDRIAGRRYDHIAGCSEDVRAFLEEAYRYDPARLSVIHNGWEGRPRPPDPPEAPTAVCVANLRPEKGHHVLLDAWERVLTEIPEARLVLVGGGPLEAEVRHRVTERGLGHAVVLTGAVSDVWPHLARAHLFVLPTLHEPFGIVAAEAMAAELPVLVSDVGGLTEFVDHDVTGRLVAAGDAPALARELVALLSDAALRERLAAAGRQRAEQLTMAETVRQYVELYERLTR